MANILEKIRENVLGAVPGFQKELVTSLVRAKSDQNDISNRLGNFQRKLSYRFQIIDQDLGIDGTNDLFELQINPQEIDQDEPFAIQVTPTQQGIVVEHQGSVLKQLVISGTTGFKPGAGAAGANGNGRFRFARGQTGYEQFHNFRNYLRRYAELKKDVSNQAKQLVFQNMKDNEFFIVEPKNFKMKRSKSNPFAYNYNITFVIIGRLSATLDTENLGWFSDIISASKQASAYIQDAEAIILGSAELLSTVTNDFTDIVLEPLQALNSALIAFENAKTRVLDIPRREINQLKTNTMNLKTNLAEAVGIDTTAYNTIVGRTSTTKSIRSEATTEDYQLMNALSDSIRGLNIVLSNNDFFGKKTMLDISKDVIDQYDGDLTIQNSQSYRVRKVLQGDTIQTIAARELSTAKRFREIIILNKLKYPYIDTVVGDGVLIPGDDILIPILEGVNEDNLIISNQEYPISESLTFSEIQLGIDLLIDKNFDLSLTNLDDYKLVASHDNAAQAVRIKIGLDKGSLKYHPEIGVVGHIGEKLTRENIFALQDSLKNTILIDPRFDDAQFDITASGSIIEVTGFVKEKAFNLVTPINLLIKRDS